MGVDVVFPRLSLLCQTAARVREAAKTRSVPVSGPRELSFRCGDGGPLTAGTTWSGRRQLRQTSTDCCCPPQAQGIREFLYVRNHGTVVSRQSNRLPRPTDHHSAENVTPLLISALLSWLRIAYGGTRGVVHCHTLYGGYLVRIIIILLPLQNQAIQATTCHQHQVDQRISRYVPASPPPHDEPSSQPPASHGESRGHGEAPVDASSCSFVVFSRRPAQAATRSTPQQPKIVHSRST